MSSIFDSLPPSNIRIETSLRRDLSLRVTRDREAGRWNGYHYQGGADLVLRHGEFVPSGVWVGEEYNKLPAFDLATPFQPRSVFMCHQDNGHLCAGWVGCHDMKESLGLRFAASMGNIDVVELAATLSYECPVELWESGAAAAAHGLTEVSDPDPDAKRIIDKLVRRRERRGNGPT